MVAREDASELDKPRGRVGEDAEDQVSFDGRQGKHPRVAIEVVVESAVEVEVVGAAAPKEQVDERLDVVVAPGCRTAAPFERSCGLPCCAGRG
jgi:hypothetical protein